MAFFPSPRDVVDALTERKMHVNHYPSISRGMDNGPTRLLTRIGELCVLRRTNMSHLLRNSHLRVLCAASFPRFPGNEKHPRDEMPRSAWC